MCTIAILIDVVGGAPIVLAANRDELYARPTLGPRVLDPHSQIVGGLDLLSGGTWLAVRPDGQFAAVTNQVALAIPPLGLRSRGLAVMELAAADDPEAYAAAIDARQYASMNLVWRDRRGVAVGYGRREEGTFEIERLGRGIHVLCNDRLGAPGFPRGVRLQRALEALPLDKGVAALREPIARALADHTRESLADTPPSHLRPELARELTATCIHSPEYGTRSATILAVGDGVLSYDVADGPACTHDLIDRVGLLRRGQP
jgi:uncharacterized protein with NRDE domain